MNESKREVDYRKWTYKVLEYTTKAVIGIIVTAFLYQGITKGYQFGYELFHSEALTEDPEIIEELEVSRGNSAFEIGVWLENKKIISSAVVFWAQSCMFDFDIRPGVYQVSSDMSSREILMMLDIGKQEKLPE